MKIEEIDLSQERQIIIMMIVSTEFLNQIIPILKIRYFKSSYAKTIVKWIIDYYNEFKIAPEKNIQSIYQSKLPTLKNEEDTEIISDLLLSLSNDWKNKSSIHNIDFLIKDSIKYLKLSSLEILKEEIENAIFKADFNVAEQKVAEYNRIEKPSGSGFRLLRDYESIAKAFTYEDEVIFTFPGILGEVCGNFLRGDLVSFLAAAKKGKSYWQWALSYMSAFCELRISFYSLEMTENQIKRRAWQSLVGQPRKDKEVEIPYFVKDEYDENKWRIKTKKENRKGVDINEIKEKQEKFRTMTRGGDVYIKTFPTNSVSIDDIIIDVDTTYYYEKFMPDIVVIDYADILAPAKSVLKKDLRNQLDYTWKTMRGFALDRNILVVTASQTNRAGFSKDASEELLAEDIRKITHVSKMIAINRNKKDNNNNMVRIEQLAERDGFLNNRQVAVINCLDIGRPIIDSRYVDEVIL